jgi:PAS domain-containing protein
VRLLTNPLVLRMLLVAVSAGSLFVLGLVLVRKMRRDLAQDGNFASGEMKSSRLEFSAYQGVIQELKQQQKTLMEQVQKERQQARNQGRLQAAALDNLPCGVLLLNCQLLVQQANPAAKQLLGFDSPFGVGCSQIFESSRIQIEPGVMAPAEAIASAAHDQAVRRELPFVYRTPAGETRQLRLDIVPVPGNAREVRGVVCILSPEAGTWQWSAPSGATMQTAQATGSV